MSIANCEVFNTFMYMKTTVSRQDRLSDQNNMHTGWKCDMRSRHGTVGSVLILVECPLTVNIRLSFKRPGLMFSTKVEKININLRSFYLQLLHTYYLPFTVYYHFSIVGLSLNG